MSMTREEAIQRFEKQLHEAMVVLDSGFGTRPGECDLLYRKRKEMAEIALQALREQEDRENPAPLTIEELRQMDGQPVWIDDWWEDSHGWELSMDAADYFAGERRTEKEYGGIWIAYRNKPKEEHHED